MNCAGRVRSSSLNTYLAGGLAMLAYIEIPHTWMKKYTPPLPCEAFNAQDTPSFSIQ